MKKSLLVIPVMATFMLTGCVQDVVGEAVGKVVGSIVRGMVVCTFQSSTVMLTNGMDLEIPKADIESIFGQIIAQKISTADDFWSKVDADTVVVLKQMVEDGFNIEIKSSKMNISDFNDALAAGFINAASKSVKGSYLFYKDVRVNENGAVHIYHAKLNIKVVGAESNETYASGICDPGSSN